MALRCNIFNCGLVKMASKEGVVQVRNSPGAVVVSSTTRRIVPPKKVALDEDEFTDVSVQSYGDIIIILSEILSMVQYGI